MKTRRLEQDQTDLRKNSNQRHRGYIWQCFFRQSHLGLEEIVVHPTSKDIQTYPVALLLNINGVTPWSKKKQTSGDGGYLEHLVRTFVTNRCAGSADPWKRKRSDQERDSRGRHLSPTFQRLSKSNTLFTLEIIDAMLLIRIFLVDLSKTLFGYFAVQHHITVNDHQCSS